MQKQLLLFVISIVLVVASLAAVVYLWWQSTPQYALLQVRRAYREKDQDAFNKYVDVANLATSFSEEIIFGPAERTPGLTKLQRFIGLGTLKSTRLKIDNSLIYQIQRLVKDNQPSQISNDDQLSTTDSGDLKYAPQPPPKLGHIISEEWQKEKKRLKEQVLQRMLEFARRTPEKIVHRIFAAPTGTRATAVKEIIAECGLTKDNFRSYNLEHIGPKAVAYLNFFSPRVKKIVAVKIELDRMRDGPLGSYRISRLVAPKDTLNELGFNTDEEVQSMLAYGLQDLNKDTLATSAKTVIKNISTSVAKVNGKGSNKRIEAAPH